MYESCLVKLQQVKNLFSSCPTDEKKHEKIIALGKSLPPYPPEEKKPENFVQGRQSIMYLTSKLEDGKVYLADESGALISAELAAIMLQAYDGESSETILKYPPTYLEERRISASLTLSTLV